ncbi:hypothetical protein HCN44_005052 [Aphidius gifuensis]|uniref:deoxyribose-phosphate aldolase n=1 Tax=Aphidius gifuensis TaxID=684658 RepID=A0A834XUF6_APHGI|nr:deoxyribose-phosphate aldolase [Aphidius gifuensis]KAF7992708.1 hypothetical protein HCN44_005052 [Aphidius gifuensis]
MEKQSRVYSHPEVDKTIKISDDLIEEKIKIIKNKANKLPDNEREIILRKSIGHIDLTSLNLDDTTETIEKLCSKAINPLNLEERSDNIHTAAVCVYPARATDAINFLINKNATYLPVASVAGDFPAGKLPFDERLQEVIDVVAMGVQEIDIVIDRSLVLNEDWDTLFKEISEMKKACGNKCLKTILSTGDLPSLEHVYHAAMVAMQAGSDFIKTSTGKETVNATLPVGIVMSSAIKIYEKNTGRKVGFKAAGGIKTANQVVEWMILVESELGHDHLDNTNLFRVGASSLLDDIVENISLKKM